MHQHDNEEDGSTERLLVIGILFDVLPEGAETNIALQAYNAADFMSLLGFDNVPGKDGEVGIDIPARSGEGETALGAAASSAAFFANAVSALCDHFFDPERNGSASRAVFFFRERVFGIFSVVSQKPSVMYR